MDQDYYGVNQLPGLSGSFGEGFQHVFSGENLVSFLTGVLYSFSFLSEKKDIKLGFIRKHSLNAPLSETFCFNTFLIGNILLSLLHTSFKYASAGDRITICAGIHHSGCTNPCLEIIITDTGAEIPKELLPAIYNHFENNKHDGYQDCGNSQSGIPGMMDLTELQNGTISVISRQDKGTRFRLRFPIGTQDYAADPDTLYKTRSGNTVIKPWTSHVITRKEAFMGKTIKIMEDNMANEHFTVNQFAKMAGMSSSQLHRKLKGATGMSALRFIRSARMHRARELLAKDAGNVAEIAYMVGYDDPSYFTRVFKSYFGHLPSGIKAIKTER